MAIIKEMSQKKFSELLENYCGEILLQLAKSQSYNATSLYKESILNHNKANIYFKSLNNLLEKHELTEKDKEKLHNFAFQLNFVLFGNVGIYGEVKDLIETNNYFSDTSLAELTYKFDDLVNYLENFKNFLVIVKERQLFKAGLIDEKIVNDLKGLKEYMNRELDLKDYKHIIKVLTRIVKLDKVSKLYNRNF